MPDQVRRRERLVKQFTQRTLGKSKPPSATINAPRVRAPVGGLASRQRQPFRSGEVAASNPHATGALAGAKRTDFTKTDASGDTFRYHAYRTPGGKRKVFRVGGPTNRKLS